MPAHSLDAAILVHMSHEVAQPTACSITSLRRSSLALGSELSTPPSLLRCELAAVGYHEIGFHPLTGSNACLAIFAPPSDESRTRPDAIIACTQ
jgi:hypothetical protein